MDEETSDRFDELLAELDRLRTSAVECATVVLQGRLPSASLVDRGSILRCRFGAVSDLLTHLHQVELGLRMLEDLAEQQGEDGEVIAAAKAAMADLRDQSGIAMGTLDEAASPPSVRGSEGG